MIVLGLDIETNGLDINNAEIVELGMVLWDTDKNKALRLENLLITNISIPIEVTAIHGITEEDVNRFGIPISNAMIYLQEYISKCDYIVAHNGNNFDKPIIERIFKREMGIAIEGIFCAKWIDTMIDIEYPENMNTRKLSYLATEHGFINPFPHRAVFDVMTMLRVVSCYDFSKIVQSSNEPMVTIFANVSFEDRQKAKDRGYFWDAAKKKWFKQLKQSKLDIEKQEAEFSVFIQG